MSSDIWSLNLKTKRENAAPWPRDAILSMDGLVQMHGVAPTSDATDHILICLNHNPLQTFKEDNEKSQN